MIPFRSFLSNYFIPKTYVELIVDIFFKLLAIYAVVVNSGKVEKVLELKVIFGCFLLHMTKSMCIAVQLSKFFSTIVNFIMSAFQKKPKPQRDSNLQPPDCTA